MEFRILDAHEDATLWSDLLRTLPGGDIFLQPEYLQLASANGEGQAAACLIEQNGQRWLYPFLRRKIAAVGRLEVPGNWYDIESPYGYGGPVSNSENPAFLNAATEQFHDWCVDENIVAEFVRFHPLTDSQQWVSGEYRVCPERETVVVDVPDSAEELWDGYPSVQRNMVRKARKHGLIAEFDDSLLARREFIRLYEQTMHRLSAEDYYHFSPDYFSDLFARLGGQLRLMVVRHESEIIAAALFLRYGEFLHYHLAGSDVRFRSLAGNNLLIHSALEWACEESCRWLHLGGGTTTASSDPLFKFKTSFSNLRRTFHIGFRAHLPHTYAMLREMWLQQTRPTDPPPYFLLYRLPVSQFRRAAS